jgi:hypothetical protein
MSFVFPTTSFLIEILAARGVPDFFVSEKAVMTLLGYFDDRFNTFGAFSISCDPDLVLVVRHPLCSLLHDVCHWSQP